MIGLIYRMLASASETMWKEELDLGDYTPETAQHELNLAYHYARRIDRLLPWLHCDYDIQKPPLGDRRPDIVFHRRGGHSLNFLAIEIKRQNDIAGGRADIRKIRRYWIAKPLLYHFGASVVFNEKERTTKLFVATRGVREALDQYRDAATMAPLAVPTNKSEVSSCVELASAVIAAERADDRSGIARLKAEIDARVFQLYGQR